MIPLVGFARGAARACATLVEESSRRSWSGGRLVAIPIGTMIELPRAAVCADEIAEHADFFSFGTNDLTQTTLGLSRDDAEGKFLAALRRGGRSSRRTRSRRSTSHGVGALVRMAAERGRAAHARA